MCYNYIIVVIIILLLMIIIIIIITRRRRDLARGAGLRDDRGGDEAGAWAAWPLAALPRPRRRGLAGAAASGGPADNHFRSFVPQGLSLDFEHFYWNHNPKALQLLKLLCSWDRKKLGAHVVVVILGSDCTLVREPGDVRTAWAQNVNSCALIVYLVYM